MKSYTDIEQSKKLAEILRLESADMFHFIHEVDTVGFGYKKNAAEHYSKTEFEYIPCWSLAALLNVLPSATLDSSDDRHYRIHCMGRYSEWYGNAVDACYETIVKLNELKML